MSDSSFYRNRNDSPLPPQGASGSRPELERRSRLLTRGLVAMGVVLSVIALCGIGLRLTIGLVSDQKPAVIDGTIQRVSHAGQLSKRDRENELVREEARRADRDLLQRRRDRLWRDECRERPGKFAAYQSWRRQVDEIEEQLADAEAIQSQLTPEQAPRGPLAEGTVLWHRKQRLLELQADAPTL